MTKLNIEEAIMLSNVNMIKDEVLLDKNISDKSDLVFFGDLDVPMQEIDAAMEKLQQMVMKKNNSA